MSFTIKCDKCGTEQVYSNESKKYHEKISIDVYVVGTFQGSAVEGIDIDCTCGNEIEIKY